MPAARPRPAAAPVGPPVHEYAPGRDAPRVATSRQLNTVRKALKRTASEVGRLPDPAIRALLPALDQAKIETKAALRGWLNSVPDADLRYTAQQERAVLAHLETAFQKIAELNPLMLYELQVQSDVAGMAAVEHLIAEVARFTAVFDQSEQQLPIEVARILAQGDTYLINRFETSTARYADPAWNRKHPSDPSSYNIAADIQREMAVGVLRRESISQMIDRLVERVGGPRGFVATRGIRGETGAIVEYIGEGLFRRYRWWAERIVRTELLAAYNFQHHASLWEAKQFIPDLKRRWCALEDLRRCDRCRAFHGVVAEIGQPFFSALGEWANDPPLHPCCRCSEGAFKSSWVGLLSIVKAELAEAAEAEAA